MGSGIMRVEMFLEGIVQGVGMRPFISRIAEKYCLTGFVGNDQQGVFLQLQGMPHAVRSATEEILSEAPSLAHIIAHRSQRLTPRDGEKEFYIVSSTHSEGEATLISPDISTCEACLKDIHDPNNRRYHYPFTTCTHCGPRLSIITSLPYDRDTTTMKDFPLCQACTAEYTDPNDRRYHAQPISCPACGPRIWITDSAGNILLSSASDDQPVVPQRFDKIIAYIHQAWDQGKIVAIRGIGGFHLTCDANNLHAIQQLRSRKRRPEKPLAVMMPNLDTAQRYVVLNPAETALLRSSTRPIVTVQKRRNPMSVLPNDLAPGLDELGIMLPYSPLHDLLVDRPIVATSGNPSGEPLCISNSAALNQLGAIADVFLLHNRDIYVPVEDSVYVSETQVRRSRGLAPIPILLDTQAIPVVLGVGGELKNTFTLAVGKYAHVSSHIGDMGSYAAQQHFERAVEQLCSTRGTSPDLVVCDLHPRYLTTRWAQRYAEKLDLPLLEVQHHHAHALSLLAEHNHINTPAVIAVLDGTGYGEDGTIWGGEVFALNTSAPQAVERVWHLPAFELAGGDQAIRHPWRVAQSVASAFQLQGIVAPETVSQTELHLVQHQLENHIATISTTSTGRLFDAIASILGIRHHTSYDAQAAMELEALARSAGLHSREAIAHVRRIGLSSISELVQWVIESETTHSLAQRARYFHSGIALLIGEALLAAARSRQTHLLGITGGCATNRLLCADLTHLVRTQKEPFVLLQHQHVPATDGGLSLGQATAGRLWALTNTW